MTREGYEFDPCDLPTGKGKPNGKKWWQFDRSTFMKNWWKARWCRGCKGLHIGRKVDHNHCDFLKSDDAHARVNGRFNHKCRSKI